MHSFVRLGCALLLVAPVATLPAQGAIKIAYVDSRYIVANAPATAGAQAVLQREVSGMQVQIQRMSDSLDALTAAFNKTQATLVGEKRDARLREISDRQGEYQQRYQALQQQAQDREEQLMQPILDQIKIALEDLRVEMGLTMIFDVSQSGAIVAADKNLNISDRVVAKLRTMPLPTIAGSGADAKADPKAAKAPPTAPVAAPAGVRGPGAPASTGGVRRDSSAKSDSAAKADSARKKTDTTATKRPPLR